MAPLLAVTALNFVSVPLFYRFLGPEMYALWFYVQTVSGSFGFIDLGIGTAINRFMGVALGRQDRVAALEYWATGNVTALPFLLFFGAGYIILGCTLGPAWFHVAPEKDYLLRKCFIGGGVALVLAYYTQFWNVLSQVHLDFKFVSLLKVLATAFQIIPSLLLAWLTRNPFVLILWGVFIGLCQLLIFVFHSRRSYNIGFEFAQAKTQRFREMAGYTGKAFATLFVNSLLTPVDRLLAGRLAPPVGFTNYTIASNLGARASSFGYAAVAPVFSNTSRAVNDSLAKSRDIYNEIFRFLSSWYFLGVVWITLWREPLCHLWLGHQIGPQVAPLLPPLILAYAISGISLISSAQLGALDRLGTQVWFHLAAGLLTIPAVYLGWVTNGVTGMAYGYACARLPLFLQDLYLLRLIHAGGWLELRTWLDIISQVALGLVFLLFSRLLHTALAVTLLLALLHGVVVSLWLLRKNLFVR